MDTYQFDKLKDELAEIKQMLFWINYPETRPALEKKEEIKETKTRSAI